MPFSTIFQLYLSGSRHVLDLMVVGFTTTYAISAYHHWCCEFEFQSGRGVQHYVMKFVRDLRQVCGFLRVLQFPPSIKWRPQYSWNIVESGVKHHQTRKEKLLLLVWLWLLKFFFLQLLRQPLLQWELHMTKKVVQRGCG
jgi:hypothetical protein